MKAIHALTVAALMASATTALAANTGWYVVGSVGQATMDSEVQQGFDAALRDEGNTLTSSFDDKDTAYKVQLGYQFTENFALEGGYINLGKAKYNASITAGPDVPSVNAEVEASGFNLSGVVTYPINEQFSVFGKLGVINAKVEANISGPAGSESIDSTNLKATWGVGAVYNVNKQWGVRAEWERFNQLGDSEETGESDVDMLSVGVVFKF